MQLAGIHKAALDDSYIVRSSTVGSVWLNCQMYKMDAICNHEPASFSGLFILTVTFAKRANNTDLTGSWADYDFTLVYSMWTNLFGPAGAALEQIKF